MPLPAATGLVHGSDETELAAISELDNARLAMQEATDAIRCRLELPVQRWRETHPAGDNGPG